MAKRRVIALKFAGKKLIAPPAGYTSRTEACVKRWLSRLPNPAEAQPDDVQTIQDVAGCDDDLASLDAMRRSCEQDEKLGEAAVEKSHGGGSQSRSQDGEVCQNGDAAQHEGANAAPSDDDEEDSSGSDPSALDGSSVRASAGEKQQDVASGAACVESLDGINPKQDKNVEGAEEGFPISQTPVKVQSEDAYHEERPGDISYSEAAVVDSSAVEIGMERYLGMAEASKEDKVSVLQEALRLAVSDRIGARMAHLAHAAKLTQECERAQSHLAERQAEIDAHLQLQEYLTERNRRQEWEHCKAQEDVFCAQQQLEGSRKALKDAVFTMEKRIADLTARNQEIGDEKSRLEEKLDAAAHEVTKLRSSTGVLEQQLDLKMVECNALNAELKDNLQRWEQESMQRMLAEEELENKKNELKIAIDEGRKAAAAAGMKDEQHKAALEDAANCGSKLQHSLTKVVQRGCTTDGSIAGLKQPLSVKSCLKNTLTQSVDQDASSADKGHPQDEKPGGTLSESADSLKPVDRNSTVLLPSQLNAGQDSVRVEIASDPVAVGRPNKPDAQAVWLQGQVVRQAFSTAPPALKALNIALRCIILAQPGSETVATQMAEKMSIHYRTLPCLVTEQGGADSGFACVDVHTIRALLPICHKAVLIELQSDVAATVNRIAKEHGVQTATWTLSENYNSECTEKPHPDEDALLQDGAADSHGDRKFVNLALSSDSSSPGKKYANIGLASAVEKTQSWIGIPDSTLQCFNSASLRSLYKGHGPAHYKLQPQQHALLDLATFSAQSVTKFSLQESCGDGKELVPQEDDVLELDDLNKLNCTAISNAFQLALHLIMNCHSVQHMDLGAVNITVHNASFLAQAISQSCGSQLETIILSKAPLPVGILLGRPAPKATQQTQHHLIRHSDRTTATLSASVTEKDLAFMSSALECETNSPLVSLNLSGTLTASKAQLERFASAVAKLQFLESFQGISCQCFKKLTGRLYPSAMKANASKKAGPIMGTVGALVFACLLQNSLASVAIYGNDTKESENLLDGPVGDAIPDCQPQKKCAVIHTVDLGGTEIGELGSERMAAALGRAQFSKIATLCLPCSLPGKQGCKAWAKLIGCNLSNCLTSLDLSSNSLGDVQLQEMTQALGQCTRLQELNLSDNSIVCKGVLSLTNAVLQSVPLRGLNLSNNSLTDEAGASISGLLLPSSTCSLSYLQLSGNSSVGSGTAAKLAQALPYTTTLRSLELARTQLTRQALPHLARALRENHSLVSLDISNSKIGVEDVTTLARVLDCNTSLQSLIMSKNSIGDQGAAAIGTLLLNSRLTYINLSHCCIRVSGARWFADVLPRAQSLRHLDVSSNSIGDVGTAALVQNSVNLTKLDLGCTDMSSSGLATVASHLSANCAKMQLRSLNLSRNSFGDKSMDQLCASVSSNTQLQSINLSGCGLGNTGVRRILNLVQAIKHSQAVSHRRHVLQEVTVSHNSRVDNVLACSLKEALLSVQHRGALE